MAAKATGTDRIELYTGPYAEEFPSGKEEAVVPYLKAAGPPEASAGAEWGHDLSLENLAYFRQCIPGWMKYPSDTPSSVMPCIMVLRIPFSYTFAAGRKKAAQQERLI